MGMWDRSLPHKERSNDAVADRVVDRRNNRCLRIYIIGDFGSGDAWQAKVAEAMMLLAKKEPPNFLLSTGDCIYPSLKGESLATASTAAVLSTSFDPYYEALATDFFQCLGNHDLIDVFGGDPTPMIAHTLNSPVWRMPSSSYRIRKLPPWIAVYVLNSNVFGSNGHLAEKELFSERAMERELESVAGTFSNFNGLKILVGHHPVFTPGKRTYRYAGDGEIRCMRRLRELIERLGIHFYMSGHEHHQSHTTGSSCEYIIQGCGGAGKRPNPKHSRRSNGMRLHDKVFRFLEVMNGFSVLDIDEHFSVRLRFIGIPLNASADAHRVIYEYRWTGLDDIGDRSLSSLDAPTCTQ